MNVFTRLASATALAISLTIPTPAAEFELVGREMTRLLQNGHYARLPFNEELSARFLERYLDALDGEKVAFLGSEIADFKRQHERSLHDHLSTKTVMPIAEGIFEVYRSRVGGRVTYVKYLLENEEFTFDDDRKVVRDRDEVDWPADGPALQKVWKESLEDMLLTEVIRRERLRARAEEAGKPDPFRNEVDVKAKVLLRFERLLKTVEGMNEEDVANYFFSAVTNAYDPHSEYFSANEMEQFKINVSNELVGIGARLDMNDRGEIEIYGIVNGGPADRQGDLKLGDRVIAVSSKNDGEWVDVMFKPFAKVIEHILGKEDAPVGLRINREVAGVDETLEIAIPRGIVTMKDDLATAKIYHFQEEEKSTKLAVITIPSFYFDFDDHGSRVSVDVERLLGRLKKEKVDGLALDLRDNGGGSLPEVQRLTGFFVGRGPVVQVKSLNGQIRSLGSLHRKPLYDGPLIVLTNRGSASATEILAGALQDYNRAVVIGSESTYGKGTVQKTMDISDYMPIFSDRERAGWLKLTFQKYYRVSGSSVQIKGVTPDVILPDMSDAYESGEGFEKYALPYDVIRKSDGFKPRDRQDLFVELLKNKSAVRVMDEQYFSYLRDDIERAKKEIAENAISLNREERLRDLKENEERRKMRRGEQIERFAKVEEADEKNFDVYRLTLDDLAKEELPRQDLDDHSEDHVREVLDEVASLEETLKWPSGIDAVKREGLSILFDLVDAKRAAVLAKVGE